VADGFRVPKPGAAIYQTQGDPAVRSVIVPVFFWGAGGAVPSPGPDPAQTTMIASNCELTLTASHPLLGQAEVQVRSVPVKHVSELA
jgi:hypothetical protein